MHPWFVSALVRTKRAFTARLTAGVRVSSALKTVSDVGASTCRGLDAGWVAVAGHVGVGSWSRTFVPTAGARGRRRWGRAVVGHRSVRARSGSRVYHHERARGTGSLDVDGRVGNHDAAGVAAVRRDRVAESDRVRGDPRRCPSGGGAVDVERTDRGSGVGAGRRRRVGRLPAACSDRRCRYRWGARGSVRPLRQRLGEGAELRGGAATRQRADVDPARLPAARHIAATAAGHRRRHLRRTPSRRSLTGIDAVPDRPPHTRRTRPALPRNPAGSALGGAEPAGATGVAHRRPDRPQLLRGDQGIRVAGVDQRPGRSSADRPGHPRAAQDHPHRLARSGP